eukprot:TRINITY_DN67915_c0_g1_i1.p1 TRINITY_DN67915_c0_g1~~TRINITY_DN67915_c0_g1_i1.p1  ORF type:complete len:519 (-),score=63.72 TRINITY_DN67915_c0_g1_i1:464-1846(-)
MTPKLGGNQVVIHEASVGAGIDGCGHGSCACVKDHAASASLGSALVDIQGTWHTSCLGRIQVTGNDCNNSLFVVTTNTQRTLTVKVEGGSVLVLDMWRANLSEYQSLGYIRWTRCDAMHVGHTVVWARPLMPSVLSGLSLPVCLPDCKAASVQDLDCVQGAWETSHFGPLQVDGASVNYEASLSSLKLQACSDGRLDLNGWRADQMAPNKGCLKWTHYNDPDCKTPVVWVRKFHGVSLPATEARVRTTLPAKSSAEERGGTFPQGGPRSHGRRKAPRSVAPTVAKQAGKKRLRKGEAGGTPTERVKSHPTAKRARHAGSVGDQSDGMRTCETVPPLFMVGAVTPDPSPPVSSILQEPAVERNLVAVASPSVTPSTRAISREEIKTLQSMMDTLSEEQLERVLEFLEPELGGPDEDSIQLDIDRLAPERQLALVKVVELEVAKALESSKCDDAARNVEPAT